MLRSIVSCSDLRLVGGTATNDMGLGFLLSAAFSAEVVVSNYSWNSFQIRIVSIELNGGGEFR